MAAHRDQRIDRRSLLGGALSAAVLAACARHDGRTAGSTGPSSTTARAAGPGDAAAAIPRPLGYVRTSWSTDPFALGSYSYLAVGAEPRMRTWLAESLDGRVFLAGEATDAANPSTVHGALASGKRVAEDVLGVAAADERVAVVGAGAAGARAARQLADAGLSVTVFEARDRVGGRLDTVTPDGWPVPVERGASWVHAIEGNDLADRLERLGIATAPFDYSASMLAADGHRAADADLAASATGARRAIDAAVAWANGRDADVSLADAVTGSGAGSRVDPGVLRHHYDTEISTEYGADPDELSAFWGLEEGTEGDDALVIGGYGRLIEALLQSIDVRRSMVLTAIRHDGAGVELSFAGSAQRFDRAVLTLPLGVLKAGAVTFDPPLPERHRRAIASIGFGLLDKLWLRFERPFWSDEHAMWTIAQDDGYTEWFNLAPATGHPVLLALVGGRRARALRSLSDEQAVATALASLQKLADAGW